MEKLKLVTVMRTGTSLAIVVPASIARDFNIQRGDQLGFAVYDSEHIVLRKLTQEEILELKPPIINYG